MNQENSFKDTLLLGGDKFTLPKCMVCKNFIGDGNDDTGIYSAFPEGIPEHVMWEQEDAECNNGIKFEKV